MESPGRPQPGQQGLPAASRGCLAEEGSSDRLSCAPQELLPRQGGVDAAGQRGDAHVGGGGGDRQLLQR